MMLLSDFLDEPVEMREERHLPVVTVCRWERIALLLWKNGGHFQLGVCNHGLAKHKTMSGLEVMELFEFKALLFGASLYTQIWEEVYIPKVQARFVELDARRKLGEKQVKWN